MFARFPRRVNRRCSNGRGGILHCTIYAGLDNYQCQSVVRAKEMGLRRRFPSIRSLSTCIGGRDPSVLFVAAGPKAKETASPNKVCRGSGHEGCPRRVS